MPNYIGRIAVPEIAPSGTFPLVTDYPHGATLRRPIVAHVFANGTEQRFYTGTPAPRYSFVRRTLNVTQRAALAAFWQAAQGCLGAFFYAVPQLDGTFVTKTVCFENAPLTLQDLTDAITSVGLTFVELPATTATYAITATVTRFPDVTLGTALLSDVQEIIPLVRIRVAEAAVPDILLSDRAVSLTSSGPTLTYLPRLLRVGEQGGDALITQSLDGSSDDVSFTFGNADRVMIALANDTDLMNARIELSLFHLGSGRKLDLWAGYIIDWSSDTGAEFTVKASDILNALTLSSPVGTCSRSCWRRYGMDGCPCTPGTQALDTVNYPSADATCCDLGYETDNGCLAHSASVTGTWPMPATDPRHYYGAVWAKPQQVKIDDNSTGLMGFGRSAITPTSQINDSLWGQSIPEIWHNDDGVAQLGLPVTARIAAGRDESDFYIALGVVGRGPLGAFSAPAMVDTDGDGKPDTFIGSTLDGQPHHGWRVDDNGNPTGNNLGLRQGLGTEPAGPNDFFSLGRVGTTPLSYREIVGGASVYEDTYASSVASCEIRRTDQPGIQLSTAESHSMIVVVSQGLTAQVWSAPGASSMAPGCTNPFWVAVNTFLRAVSLLNGALADQEAAVDIPAAVAMAAVADTMVPSLFGTTLTPNPSDPNTDVWMLSDNPTSSFTLAHIPLAMPTITLNDVTVDPSTYTWTPGTNEVDFPTPITDGTLAITYQYANGTYTSTTGMERQFRFKGTVDPSKPTRDWIRDILNNALGYFTWSFGKLRVGCRATATPQTTFAPGNILLNTLRLDPIKPAFEKLTITFADQDYLYARNTVNYLDQDYAARHNRIQNPREAQLGLVGSSTKSQSMRIAVCRTREELGGVTLAEQTAARTASWGSTILALDVEAGAVVSIKDSEIAGGSMAFRVQSWTLNRDWSVKLNGKTVTASMYDLTQGMIPGAIIDSVQPAMPPAAPTVVNSFVTEASGEMIYDVPRRVGAIPIPILDQTSV